MNLFDLTKTRIASINEEWTSLNIIYEFSSNPLSSWEKNKSKKFNKKTSIGKIKCHVVGQLDNKTFVLNIKTNKPERTFLYQLILCFTYIVGKNISVNYYVDNFPYYPVKREFDFDRTSCPSQIKSLITNPPEILQKALVLLRKKDAFFKKIVPLLEEINIYDYQQITFLIEFSLLEKLANEKIKLEGRIFPKNSNELKELKSFSKKAIKLLSSFTSINIEPIKSKLSTYFLNSKGTTKEKLNTFIDSFGNKIIDDYKSYVKKWSQIRSQLAHGLFSNEDLKKDINVMRKIHTLLVDIVDLEFDSKL